MSRVLCLITVLGSIGSVEFPSSEGAEISIGERKCPLVRTENFIGDTKRSVKTVNDCTGISSLNGQKLAVSVSYIRLRQKTTLNKDFKQIKQCTGDIK